MQSEGGLQHLLMVDPHLAHRDTWPLLQYDLEHVLIVCLQINTLLVISEDHINHSDSV